MMTNEEHKTVIAAAFAMGGFWMTKGDIRPYNGTETDVVEFMCAFARKSGFAPLSAARAQEVWREHLRAHLEAARGFTRLVGEPVTFRTQARIGYGRCDEVDVAQQLAAIHAA